jgi:hypothetical protein
METNYYLIVFGPLAAIAIVAIAMETHKRSKMTRGELEKYEIEQREALKKSFIVKVESVESQWGSINLAYICPHCQTKGFVRTMPVKRKKGVSGAKVTGALLTAGVSIFATGLSRKEGMTQAHCENCNSTWDF